MMDARRFDAMTRRAASRRAAIRAGGLGLAALALPWRRAAARQATPVASPVASANPEFLFVQAFDHGTWLPKPGEEGTYLLTLFGAAAETVYFSDRPDRIAGQVPTQQFLDALGFTPASPANAAIVAERAVRRGTQEVLVIELRNPVYDADAGTLTYEARVLEDYGEHGLAFLAARQDDFELAELFGSGSLFIDDCADGRATCTRKRDGSRVGAITTIGCCWSWSELECRVCDHDGDDDSYGQLCAAAFPDECGPADGTYPCHGADRVCHGDPPPPG